MKPEQQKAFDEFWAEWPKKVAKKQAERAWSRISQAKYPTIMSALCRHKRLPTWTAKDGLYIPNPATWLNGARWEDEVSLPEDRDADLLIEALTKESSMPHDLPKHISERVMRMMRAKQLNWPRVHYRMGVDPDAAEQIKRYYLGTPLT